MICNSKSAIDPAPQDVIKTTRWNNIRDAIGMHKVREVVTLLPALGNTINNTEAWQCVYSNRLAVSSWRRRTSTFVLLCRSIATNLST
jgi:hypothetical protein